MIKALRLAGYASLFGGIEGGVVRGGVASKEDWRDGNAFRARRLAAKV